MGEAEAQAIMAVAPDITEEVQNTTVAGQAITVVVQDMAEATVEEEVKVKLILTFWKFETK